VAASLARGRLAALASEDQPLAGGAPLVSPPLQHEALPTSRNNLLPRQVRHGRRGKKWTKQNVTLNMIATSSNAIWLDCPSATRRRWNAIALALPAGPSLHSTTELTKGLL
jgi:hypothetical protein